MGKNKTCARRLHGATIAFVILASLSEAMHVHNPSHSNRREKLEEERLRSLEAHSHRHAARNLSSGGNPPPQPELPTRHAEARRRRHGEDRPAMVCKNA